MLNLTTGIDTVLEKGGFKVKNWVTNANLSEYPESRTTNILSNPSSEKRLGIWWDTITDKLFYKVKINFSKKKMHNKYESPDITLQNFFELFPLFLTLRIVLSQVSKLFDPMGFLIPFLLLAKFLMRKSCSKNSENKLLKWDEELPPDLYNQWKRFFLKLLSVEKLRFARCIRPEISIGDPLLIIYDDGSKEAFGACAYARWKVGDNSFWARLIMAKNRIGPAHVITVPRMELCGPVIAVRLRQTIEEEMKWKFSQIIHITDSTIVFGQIHSESHQFKTFEGNRISEIQTKSNHKEWYWAPSEANPADLTTRVTDPGELGEGSVWQNGYDYLKKKVAEWPISQKVTTKDLPNKVNTISINQVSSDVINLPEIISVERYNSTDRLLKVTAIVTKSVSHKHFISIHTDLSEAIKKAEIQWVKHEQRTYIEKYNTKLKSLGPKLKGTQTRFSFYHLQNLCCE